MASLIYTSAEGQRTELPLKAGINRVGRVEGNDILVPDDSVSENHCELILEGSAVSVRDLGTVTGTAINGAPVQEGPLLPGEVIRVGNVEFVLEDSPATTQPNFGAGAAPVIPGEACRNHADVPAKWRCSKCAQQFCDACVAEGRQFGVPGVKFCPLCKSHAVKIGAAPARGGAAPGNMTFGGEMLAAWAYPFRGNGSIIMFTGTIFFAVAAFVQARAFGIGWLVSLMTTGYWMAYAQKVVGESGNGESEPPTWPDFANAYEDIIVPFFHAVGMSVAYLLPFVLARTFLPEGEMSTLLISGALLLAGLFMMPMAWLAISMHESIVGVNPRFVIPSILRIPGQYIAIFLELVVLVAINIGLNMLLAEAKIPFLGALLSSFLGIYFGIVICRLLGSMYFLNRSRLGWF